MLRISRFKILKLIPALLLAIRQSLGRVILWVSCHGIELPWLGWAERTVMPSTLERYRRRAMLSRLRVQRYRIARGPYFVRSRIEKASETIRLLQFPVLLGSKITLALLICLAPFFIFFVVRVYLPVQQRIVVSQSHFTPELFARAKAVTPLVSASESFSEMPRQEQFQSSSVPVTEVFSVESRSRDDGQITAGEGSAHTEMRRGWILESGAEKHFQFPAVREARQLRFRYRPIPAHNTQVECKLQVRRENGEILHAGTFNISALSRQTLVKSPLTRRLQEKLLPEFARNRVSVASGVVSFGLDVGESGVLLKIEPLSSSEHASSCKAIVFGFEMSGSKRIARSLRELRSLLFVTFDSLHADLAVNESVMPWLSGFLTSPRTIHFAQHHARDVRKGESLRTLLGDNVRQDVGVSLASEQTILGKLRALGYRVVLAGNFRSLENIAREFKPDVMIRIENDTYEPSLVLSELNSILDEEGGTPLVIVLRLNGMSGAWRPFASDLKFGNSGGYGQITSTSDSLMRAHLTSLDRVLGQHLSELKQRGLFEKMDVVITAERGFDLGLNKINRDKPSTRSQELILNQETLRVPLGVSLASSASDELHHLLKTQYYLTTHNDLARTLWENMGVWDAKYSPNTTRLWKKDELSLSQRNLNRFSSKKTETDMRKIAIKSKIQEGVIFFDPDSAGGFLKYVSQFNPTRVNIPKANGWQGQTAVDVDAGERFFQISQRGRREEPVARVNSQFLKEARRILRQERRAPLSFRFAAHSPQEVDLLVVERGTGESQIDGRFPAGLSLQSSPLSAEQTAHRISGVVQSGDVFEIRSRGAELRFSENGGEGVLIACPEAFVFTPEAVNDALSQKVLCLLDAPAADRLEAFDKLNLKTISFWLVEDEQTKCTNDEANSIAQENVTGCGLGADVSAARF